MLLRLFSVSGYLNGAGDSLGSLKKYQQLNEYESLQLGTPRVGNGKETDDPNLYYKCKRVYLFLCPTFTSKQQSK